MRLIKLTKSICPECLRVIDATIYEEGSQVLIGKDCPSHGRYEDVYWSDYGLYERAKKFEHEGTGIGNPRTETKNGCPFDCGICPQHRSHTALALIDVTNRCNLRCPVCFASAAEAGYVYEPTREQVKSILENFRNNRPVPAPAVQFAGGEPTVRNDFVELVRMAKEAGFHHIEVATNGIKFAESLDFCEECAEAGLSALYLQFDGVIPEPYIKERGCNLLPMKMKAIENCRKAGLVVILVPTVIRGVNDDQLGDIIEFAVKNSDVIRCVNFQPVSITGRIDYEKRREMRITIPDCMKLIEEQTRGRIKVEDFYPVPFVVSLSRAIGALKDKEFVEFTAHPHCGMATYIFVEDGDIVPITRYVDVEKFMESMENVYDDVKRGAMRRAKLRMLTSIRYVKWGLLKDLVWDILRKGSYDALARLHYKMIMIGMMHFMDRYNFELERVRRCVIHYGIPDGRIIPFCTMNSIHRQEIEQAFSIPLDEWRRATAPDPS